MKTYTLTEAKAKLSELISRVHFGNEKFTITRKGKAVAVVFPADGTAHTGKEDGLIRAKGAIKQHEDAIDELVEIIYTNRERSADRKVEL